MNEAASRINNSQAAKLRIHIANTFLLGNRYTKTYIKERLQQLYILLDIKGTDGKPKNAKASHLQDFHMFLLKDCKIDVKGKLKNGYEIIKVFYTIK